MCILLAPMDPDLIEVFPIAVDALAVVDSETLLAWWLLVVFDLAVRLGMVGFTEHETFSAQSFTSPEAFFLSCIVASVVVLRLK